MRLSKNTGDTLTSSEEDQLTLTSLTRSLSVSLHTTHQLHTKRMKIKMSRRIWLITLVELLLFFLYQVLVEDTGLARLDITVKQSESNWVTWDVQQWLTGTRQAGPGKSPTTSSPLHWLDCLLHHYNYCTTLGFHNCYTQKINHFLTFIRSVTQINMWKT